MHFSRGHFSVSNKIVKSILEGSRSVEDFFRAYNVSMDTYTSTEDWAGAVAFGSRILDDLGVPTPKNPTILNVVHLLMTTKRLMKGSQVTWSNYHEWTTQERRRRCFFSVQQLFLHMA